MTVPRLFLSARFTNRRMATDDAALPGVPTRTRYRRWRNKLWIHRARVAWIIGGLAAAALLWALARMLTGSAPDGAAKRGRGRSGEHVIQPRVRDMVAKTPVEDRDIGKRPGAEACGPGGAVERYRGTSEDFWLCVHSDSDVISDSVREKGVWDDCEDQAWLLWTLFGGTKGAQGERGWVGSAAGSDAREGSAKEIGRSLNIVEVLAPCAMHRPQADCSLSSLWAARRLAPTLVCAPRGWRGSGTASGRWSRSQTTSRGWRGRCASVARGWTRESRASISARPTAPASGALWCAPPAGRLFPPVSRSSLALSPLSNAGSGRSRRATRGTPFC